MQLLELAPATMGPTNGFVQVSAPREAVGVSNHRGERISTRAPGRHMGEVEDLPKILTVIKIL